jgi:hypothetical protein
MKRLNLVIFFLSIFVGVNAQKDQTLKNEKKNSIFGNKENTELGWFFRLEKGYTQLNKQDIWKGGGSAGMIINHNLSVGVSGKCWNIRQGFLNQNVFDTTGACLEGGYGGFLLEYTVPPKSPVKITFSILIGSGGAAYLINKKHNGEEAGSAKMSFKLLDYDIFFAIEPGGHIQFNIFKFMRLNAGISYCYVGNLQLMNTSRDVMNNFTTTLGIEFGKF